MALDVKALSEAAGRGDHRAIRRACLDAAAGGASPAGIVEVLAAVQVDVGERWLTGRAGIADEHRSTSAVDSALAALDLRLPAPPSSRPVVCVCAEGEWHAVASRMVALVFAAAGRPTVFLGPSLPAGDLARFASGADAAVVAVTCSTVAALPGAARCVAAVAGAGVPVAVGGHAFRAVPAAAEQLGATYLDDLGAAPVAIDDVKPVAPTREWDDDGVAALDLAHGRLVEVAAEGLLAGRGVCAGEAGVVEEAVGYALGFGRAAVLLRDRSVIGDHRAWLESFLAGRAAPVGVDDLLGGVESAVAEVLGHRTELVRLLAS